MREIKFRALRKGQHFKGWLCWEILDGFSSPRDVIDILTICQSTGLKDKNGKEIYEGDIVGIKYYRKGGGPLPDEIIGQCVFVNGGFFVGDIPCSEMLENNRLAIKGEKLPMDWEVIGNIYENPDLLTHKE